MRAASAPYLASDIATACRGIFLCGDRSAEFDAISTDSRDIRKNDLFVPLVGPTYDGHDFLFPALEAGARGSLVARDVDREIRKHLADSVLIQVQDTLQALSDLASSHRKTYPLPLIAVTGSTGKTTVKEMIATVLGRSHRPLVSEANYNNTIGLPMTVLRLNAQHTAAVVEAGINMNHEMETLARAACPDVAVITTIGPVHLEGLGSTENVAREKFKLVEALPSDGTAVLPEGDTNLAPLLGACPAKIVTFGLERGDFRASKIVCGRTTVFEMVTPLGRREVNLGIPGGHNIINALACAAACTAIGVTLDNVAHGLDSFTALPWRMEIIPLPGDRSLIVDCYNANPQSMSAALKTLAGLGAGKKTLAILADMKELGEHAKRLHEDLGREAGQLEIDRLVYVGDYGEAVANGYKEALGDFADVTCRANKDEAWEAIEGALGEFGAILVKGSRATKMETIADRISEEK